MGSCIERVKFPPQTLEDVLRSKKIPELLNAQKISFAEFTKIVREIINLLFAHFNVRNETDLGSKLADWLEKIFKPNYNFTATDKILLQQFPVLLHANTKNSEFIDASGKI